MRGLQGLVVCSSSRCALQVHVICKGGRAGEAIASQGAEGRKRDSDLAVSRIDITSSGCSAGGVPYLAIGRCYDKSAKGPNTKHRGGAAIVRRR